MVSGKGGVGKSSVTVNLATALASRGFTVGILDVDIHGPSVPRLLGASASVMADENGKMLPVPCGERMSLISMDSFLKDKDTAILWRGPKKTGAIRQFLTDVQWGALDYLVIDSPPGTGDEHLTVLDAIPDAGCIVVTTPQEISLADAAGLLSITPEHFCRLFRKYTGQTFLAYVNQIRMEHFHTDLLETDKNITFLLDKNGITNYKGFLRKFKEAYGESPKEVRRKQLGKKQE